MKKAVSPFFAVLLVALSLTCAVAEENKFVAPLDTNGMQSAEIVATEYAFNPDYIIVKAGVPVTLTVRKEPSVVPHNFVLTAPDAGVEVFESISVRPKVITFTFTKPGKFLFYCDKKFLFFKSHRERGMVGIFEVVQ